MFIKLSIIIPCFNEENNIPYLINKLDRVLNDNSIEVILVNNGSTDNSKLIIEELISEYENLKLINLKINKGYGNGIIEGLKFAKGEFLAWTHADLQTNPQDILKSKNLLLKSEKVFVKGRRHGRPIFDMIFTISMSVYSTLFLRTFLWDINAQPTIFPKYFFKSWVNPPKDFSLDLFAYFQAKQKGYKIYRFPVNFNKRLFGLSSWNFNISSKIKFILRTIKYIHTINK